MTQTARVGIALGWLAAVAAAVWAGQGLMEMGRAQQNELSQKQEHLTRLEGWLGAEDQVAARRKETLGKFAQMEGADAGWLLLQGLQETAQAQGLSITDLRPSQVKGQKKRKPVQRVDAKLEGSLEQVDRFLQELPKALPGIRVENFQLVPQDGGRVESAVRMEWAL